MVVFGKDFEREALQGAHLDHGFDVRAKDGEIEEADVVAGEVETAGAGEVDEGGRGGGQSAMPEIDKLAASLVPLAGVGEDFFGRSRKRRRMAR